MQNLIQKSHHYFRKRLHFNTASFFSTHPYQNIPIATNVDLQDLIGRPLPLDNVLKEEILKNGPMPFATFMEKCLLDEKHGYYMKRDVFNSKGDFVTSPEVSQMFGETLGIWCINFLEKTKTIDLEQAKTKIEKEKKFSLMEFGPGRGTLMADIIRVLHQFNLLSGIEINFIEYSPFMRKLQQENMLKTLQKFDIWMKYEVDETKRSKVEKFTSEDPNRFISLRWFRMYEHYLHEDFSEFKMKMRNPNKQGTSPLIVLAHEFFDALPVNIFEYSHDNQWCERLVNICHDPTKGKKFEFILSDSETDNVKKILNPYKVFSEDVKKTLKPGSRIEISPRSLILTNSLSELISKINGALLMIDYGNDHGFSNSVRAIRNHKFLSEEMLLEFPGEVDLSAYVNFLHLKASAEKVPDIKGYGPIPQGLFLESMGMNTRLEMLCKFAKPNTVDRLESEYLRLVSPEEMGDIYKFVYIGRKNNGEIFPFIGDDSQQIYF